MDNIIVIKSDQEIPIDENFKIFAGPGAGKTHWLIQHIKSVIRDSQRLSIGQKIACITYTNVGVDTIKNRLPYATDKVTVSTIHSFFYENIVRYYLGFIAENEHFNVDKLKVVDDESLISYSKTREIGQEVKQSFIDADLFNNAIRKCRWHFENNNLEFKPDYPFRASPKRNQYISNKAYTLYKEKEWSNGRMTYDDILYFTFKLINKFPMLLEVIKATYPYFFVDEFQDSTPLQVEILKRIADQKVVVGVVGDKAQSIYSFTGADPELFENFGKDNNIKCYEIENNRRSTYEIISLLNKIRTDLTQVCCSNKHGCKPIVYIGDCFKAYENAMNKIGKGDILHFLTYRNETVNAFREHTDINYAQTGLKNHIEDNNTKRVNLIVTITNAIELARQGNFDRAFRKLDKFDYKPEDSIKLLKKFLDDYKSYSNNSLAGFLNYLKNLKFKISGLSKGKAKTFYESHSYKQLALGMDTFDQPVLYRTIHKAKGDEFNNVFISIEYDDQNKRNADFLTNPDLLHQESQRVYYVAISRAKQNLFIQFPMLSDSDLQKIKQLPVDIVEIK